MGSGNDITGLGAQQKKLQLKLGTVTSMLNVHVQLEALDRIPSIPQSQQDQDRCSQDWLIGMTAMWMQKWDTPLNNHSQLTFVATWDIELHNSGKLPVNLQSTSARFCIWTTATQVSLQEGYKLTSAKSHVCCPHYCWAAFALRVKSLGNWPLSLSQHVCKTCSWVHEKHVTNRECQEGIFISLSLVHLQLHLSPIAPTLWQRASDIVAV